MIKVDKGIKIPTFTRGKKTSSKSKYPFSRMFVGDSFFIQASNKVPASRWNKTKETTKKMAAVNAAARNYCKTQNYIKITCRTVDRGIRVWRVK